MVSVSPMLEKVTDLLRKFLFSKCYQSLAFGDGTPLAGYLGQLRHTLLKRLAFDSLEIYRRDRTLSLKETIPQPPVSGNA